MRELEKILEEIKQEKLKHWDSSERLETDKLIGWCFDKCTDIIRNHMNDGWIPVEERLPERDKTVLACQRGGAIESAWHDGVRWKTGFSHADWLRDVVAWRPLPEPYQAERSDNNDGE